MRDLYILKTMYWWLIHSSVESKEDINHGLENLVLLTCQHYPIWSTDSILSTLPKLKSSAEMELKGALNSENSLEK